ncbi:unnamed protein product [Camellia sinensis]
MRRLPARLLVAATAAIGKANRDNDNGDRRGGGARVVEPYNSVLSMHSLPEHTDVAVLLDNESIYESIPRATIYTGDHKFSV